MNYLKEKLEEMLADEQGAVDEYVELTNELLEAGVPKSEAVKVFNIAKDEHKHYMVLRNLLKKLQ